MQSAGALPGQWPSGDAAIGAAPEDDNSPIMSATLSGPVEQFFSPVIDDSLTPSPSEFKGHQILPDLTSRSQQPLPPRSPMQELTAMAALGPPAGHTLNNAKSTPVLSPSRPPAGSVRTIATKFDQAGAREQPQLTVRTSQERYRRPVKSSTSPTKAGVRKLQKSPMKEERKRLQKERPAGARSPVKSPETSFGPENSFESASTLTSTKSAPPQKHAQAPYMSSRPLFGEITADGQWNGNFEIGPYGPLPSFTQTHRRSSDSGVMPGHARSQSHQDILQPASTTAMSPPQSQVLHHKRSRSDIDAVRNAPPVMYPTPPNSGTRNPPRRESPASRIPVSNHRRPSRDSQPSSGSQSRTASAMSNPPLGRNRLSKSPTRKAQMTANQNSHPSAIPRGRYQSPPVHTNPNGQTLSAKIVAPPPKLSPPLRSSRPRQPVSSATTSASRARAADRFEGQGRKDGRRPSEQWLGQPYDRDKERSRRRIPELGNIDFEARRERIQKAISQNLEETRSQASSKGKTNSYPASQVPAEEPARDLPAEAGALNSVDQRQAAEMDAETARIPGGWPTPGGLSVDTFNVPEQRDRELEPQTANTNNTAETEFELEESPVLGRPPTQEDSKQNPVLPQGQLLTPATYQQPTRRVPSPISTARDVPAERVQSPSVLENVLQMRSSRRESQETESLPEYGEDEGGPEDSASDLENRWGLDNGLKSVQGSIKIMLDEDPGAASSSGGVHRRGRSWGEDVQDELLGIRGDEYGHAQLLNRQAYAANGFRDSPVSDLSEFAEQQQVTPRRATHRNRDFQPEVVFSASAEELAADPELARMLEQYQSHGELTPSMLDQMQRHMVDLQRMSANEGSNGFMIQNLLDSILDVQQQQNEEMEERQKQAELGSSSYDMPQVTPDTPPGWEPTEGAGTAVVYRHDNNYEGSADEEEEEEEDFYVKIRKADEAWEQQQRGEYLRLEIADEDDKPMPPPKDAGYTPRSATEPGSAGFPPDLMAGLRISNTGQFDMSAMEPPADEDEEEEMEEIEQLQPSTFPTPAPPQPSYAPPPPPAQPSSSSTRLPFGMPEAPPMQPTLSDRGSIEMSPRAQKVTWGNASGSSRPSIDSQRTPANTTPLPASVSMTSFTESTTKTSMDAGPDSARGSGPKAASPSPEQKRLQKRRHVIKELVDTENTYHQDLKIIEDIYRATAVPDLISPDDKKALFGNCDEIEKFSLHFYDEMRKAVASVYVPAKQMRWMNKRGSYSTTQSDGTTQTTILVPDNVDDEKDRSTTIGQAFVQNLQRMEQVYSFYLKNHDTANQRLHTLRNTPTVKCWLDECHNNASDITSAWDLDSLLVKPTQRVAKYPMLLQQLLETTPAGHPDREALSSAARDSVSMLTRINEAKKRADLVDQIVNRKRKDSNDVRSGLAKAFGRRTEKLKERVGIAEAFQDPDFDQLAHKFGGHFIRLQICMRDVQDYMNRTEKSMDQINNYANALDLFTDVSMSSGSELESKWRKYGQAVRETTAVAFTDHKAAVHKRVIGPMIACIKLHDGPQNAINNRKKRIVDYAKCKSMEKRGEKPDKRMVESSEMYIALNDQLKLELPKLYSLTANLVQGCLNCFLEIQLSWHNTWERKLRPVLEEAEIPTSIHQIEPAFRADFDLIQNRCMELGICNGAVLADSANFLSPTVTMDVSEPSSAKRPHSSKRTMSVGSDTFPPGPTGYKRRSSSYAPGTSTLDFAHDPRMRSSSSLSNRDTPTPSQAQTPGSAVIANRPWSNSNAPASAFTPTRPATATQPPSQPQTYVLPPPRASAENARASAENVRRSAESVRRSAENLRSPRPDSSATYFTAKPELDDARFSGIFNSAMPTKDEKDGPADANRPTSPNPISENTPVLFVCASLFEFSIDKTRKEAGYPYLTYVSGEVFDVIAQKGELWLAKNQDDASTTLGWIWEQHFVILSQE